MYPCTCEERKTSAVMTGIPVSPNVLYSIRHIKIASLGFRNNQKRYKHNLRAVAHEDNPSYVRIPSDNNAHMCRP